MWKPLNHIESNLKLGPSKDIINQNNCGILQSVTCAGLHHLQKIWQGCTESRSEPQLQISIIKAKGDLTSQAVHHAGLCSSEGGGVPIKEPLSSIPDSKGQQSQHSQPFRLPPVHGQGLTLQQLIFPSVGTFFFPPNVWS